MYTYGQCFVVRALRSSSHRQATRVKFHVETWSAGQLETAPCDTAPPPPPPLLTPALPVPRMARSPPPSHPLPPFRARRAPGRPARRHGSAPRGAATGFKSRLGPRPSSPRPRGVTPLPDSPPRPTTAKGRGFFINLFDGFKFCRRAHRHGGNPGRAIGSGVSPRPRPVITPLSESEAAS